MGGSYPLVIVLVNASVVKCECEVLVPSLEYHSPSYNLLSASARLSFIPVKVRVNKAREQGLQSSLRAKLNR